MNTTSGPAGTSHAGHRAGAGTRLRDAVRSGPVTPHIGVFDMFSASVAAGRYDGLFVSGFGFAASHDGLPDIGFIAWPDMVAFVQRLRLAFPGHHLLVDIGCLFAAQSAMDEALSRLAKDDGRLPEDSVGVAGCLELLERNISRHHAKAPG